MALSSRSLINYGIQVTSLNQNLDFVSVMAGSTLTATLPLGFYSVTSLAQAVVFALQAADSDNSYTCTVTRNILGGVQNRMTIATTGTFLSLLFASGPNVNTTCASLLGFLPIDYTGQLFYTNSASIGTVLIPEFPAYTYSSPTQQAKVFGSVNVSASGLKESVVFAIQKFIDLEFKYEDESQLPDWLLFFTWSIQQRPFDFTPQVIEPDVYYQVTLEKTSYDSKGLGFKMKEMLPQFPNIYTTGPLNFRVILQGADFQQPT